MRAFTMLLCGVTLLATAVGPAAAGGPGTAAMPEFELSGRRVNTAANIVGRLPTRRDKMSSRRPDLEYELSGRLPKTKANIGGWREVCPETIVGRRVNRHENFAGRLTDPEVELSGRLPKSDANIAGHRVNLPHKASSQFPTPTNE